MDIRHAVGVRTGIPEAKLAALDRYHDSPQFTAREVAALGYAEQILREGREVSDACFARLREHFSEPDVVELTFIVGFQTFASQFAKAFQLAPQGLASAGVHSPGLRGRTMSAA
jgi:alkylhydroperoxidase family enzyme